jgi:hypothetical protein
MKKIFLIIFIISFSVVSYLVVENFYKEGKHVKDIDNELIEVKVTEYEYEDEDEDEEENYLEETFLKENEKEIINPKEKTKSIKLISPKDREKWEVGKTYEIKWEAEGVNKVDIWATGQDSLGTVLCLTVEGYQCHSPCGGTMIGENISASIGSFSWTPEHIYTSGGITIQERVADPKNEKCLRDFSRISVSHVFDIHYSFGPEYYDHSIDTRTNKYVYYECEMEKHSPSGSSWPVYKDEFDFKLTESERKKINDAIIENGLLNFKKTTFIDYCLTINGEETCISVDPPSQKTLKIIVGGTTVKTIKAGTFLKKDEEHDRFMKVVKIIDDIVSEKLRTLNRNPRYCTIF